MSREIRYRIWCVKENRYRGWNEWRLIKDCDGVTALFDFQVRREVTLLELAAADHPDHVAEQFTGQHDSQSQPIYEGDIVSFYDGEQLCVVQYCDEYAKFGFLIVMQHGEPPENDAWMWFDDDLRKAVVIGNIHENGDLIQ